MTTQWSVSQRPPSLDEVPVPDILNRLSYPHEQRPRGSTAMIDAAGARARLHEVRPGAWLGRVLINSLSALPLRGWSRRPCSEITEL
jgi:hypothetical protein